MGDRRKLPDRRPSVTRDVIWARAQGELRFTVTLGFDPSTGAVRAVSASGDRGSDIGATIVDACVIISHALQHGARTSAMSSSMLKVAHPSLGGTVSPHASVLGAIMECVASAVVDPSSGVL